MILNPKYDLSLVEGCKIEVEKLSPIAPNALARADRMIK